VAQTDVSTVQNFFCVSFNLLRCVKSINIWRTVSTLELVEVFWQILVWILRYRRTFCSSHTSQAHSKSRKVPITYVIHVRPY